MGIAVPINGNPADLATKGLSMFQMVEVMPGLPGLIVAPMRRKDGTLRLLRTGKAASKFCRIVSEGTGRKIQPRRFSAVDWKAREIARFDDGTYDPLPWCHETWWHNANAACQQHYAHVSRKYPGRVAFTESEQKGLADIQTPMKAGRYLTRYFADRLSNADIAAWAARFSNQFESGVLQFAETAEEIEEVYTNGPTSCMSHKAEVFPSYPYHPTAAYASGDTAVAYLMRDGRVTARCVVSRSKMIHGRIYGDAERLRPLLLAADYANGNGTDIHGRWNGVKLAVIEHKGGYVMPYLDCSGYVTLSDDKESFLIVQQPGMGDRRQLHDACMTSGMIGDWRNEEDYYICDDCGDDELTEDDMYELAGRTLCRGCYEDVTGVCDRCLDRVQETTTVLHLGNGVEWCPRCVYDYSVDTEDAGHVSHLSEVTVCHCGTAWHDQRLAIACECDCPAANANQS